MANVLEKIKSKFTKKKFVDEYKKTNEKIRKRIVEKKENPVDMTLLEEVVEQMDLPTVDLQLELTSQNKTFYRIDMLEQATTWSITTLLSLQGDFVAFKLDTNTKLDELEKKVDAAKEFKADVVKDTTDGSYKDVKQIIIDKAINANQILYNGNYLTLDNVLNSFKFDNAKYADEAGNAKTSDYTDLAGVAKTVEYQNGVHTLDTIMIDYLSDRDWKEIIMNSNDFDSFKQNLLKRVGNA